LATNESGRDDDDEENAEGDERDESAPRPAVRRESDDIPAQVPADEPRNRAERRAQSKRARLEAGGGRAGAEAVDARPGRKPPPKTLSGKSGLDELPSWARNIANWIASRGRTLVVGALTVLLAIGATIGWRFRVERREASAGALYRDALEIQNARIRAADAPPDPPNSPPRRGPTFRDIAARNRAALAAFRRVSATYGDTPSAPLARLSEGNALYALARYAEARRVLEALIGVELAGQEPRLRELLAYTFEALGNNERALQHLQELGRIQDGAWRDGAAYHQARVLYRMNQPTRARDLLHTMLERLNRARPDDPTGPAGQSAVYSEAQDLLREVAPDDPLGRRAPTQNREELIQMLQRQMGGRLRIPPGAGGSAPAGGSGGGAP